MRNAAVAAATFALVAGLAARDGGPDPTTWGWATLALSGAVAVVAARRPAMPPRLALWLVGLLAALAAWTLASAMWSVQVEATVQEAERTLLYVAAAAFLALVIRAEAVAPALAGVCAAAGGTATWAIGQRVLAREEDLGE